jgi:hypothetical protein
MVPFSALNGRHFKECVGRGAFGDLISGSFLAAPVRSNIAYSEGVTSPPTFVQRRLESGG